MSAGNGEISSWSWSELIKKVRVAVATASSENCCAHSGCFVFPARQTRVDQEAELQVRAVLGPARPLRSGADPVLFQIQSGDPGDQLHGPQLQGEFRLLTTLGAASLRHVTCALSGGTGQQSDCGCGGQQHPRPGPGARSLQGRYSSVSPPSSARRR